MCSESFMTPLQHRGLGHKSLQSFWNLVFYWVLWYHWWVCEKCFQTLRKETHYIHNLTFFVFTVVGASRKALHPLSGGVAIMWLRSEQRDTYRRGRRAKQASLSNSGAANSRKTSSVRIVRRTLGLSNNSSGRCHKISRCRRRSQNLLQEVSFLKC